MTNDGAPPENSLTTGDVPRHALDETAETTPVGQRIRARRIDLGLSQADVAEGMLSPSYVSLVESGRRQPAAGALAHIAERLGVDVEFLRDGVDATVRARARIALKQAHLELMHADAKSAHAKLLTLVDDPGLNDEQKRTVQLLSAQALERQGDYASALEILDELTDKARRAPEAYPWLDVALAAIHCHSEIGDFGLAIQVGEEAMEAAAGLGMEHTDEYVKLGNTVMAAYQARNDLHKASRLSNRLKTISEEIGLPHTRGRTYWNAALLAQAKGQLAEALELMKKAVVLIGESDDKRNLPRSYNANAELLLDIDPSEANAKQARDIVTKYRDDMNRYGTTTDVGILEITLARAEMYLGNLDAARQAINDALNHISAEAPRRRAIAQVVLADIYRLAGDTGASLRETKDAAATLEQVGTVLQAAAAWRKLGDLYQSLGRTEDALGASQRAMDCAGVRRSTFAPAETVDTRADVITLP
jgi:transcriptional regulator with XRE-family HTH domain